MQGSMKSQVTCSSFRNLCLEVDDVKFMMIGLKLALSFIMLAYTTDDGS